MEQPAKAQAWAKEGLRMDSVERVQEPRKDLNDQPLSLRSIGFSDLNETLHQC